jgi:hypothetical protein
MTFYNFIKNNIVAYSIIPLYSWIKNEQLFRRFINRLYLNNNEVNNKKNKLIYIVLHPWFFSALPWFLITLGLAYLKQGKEVVFVIDDTFIYRLDWQFYVQLNSIKRIIEKLAFPIKTVILSQVRNATPINFPEGQLENLLKKNLIIRSRVENFPEISHHKRKRLVNRLKKAGEQIQHLLTEQPPDYLIVGGGGFSTSGLWVEIGKKLNVRVATVDSGFSLLLISTDGIAAYLDDIPRAFHLLGQEGEWVIAEAQAEMQRRMRGRGQFQFQAIARTGQGRVFDVLLPLNLSFDLAGLERHRVFASQMEWLLETVAWVLENTQGRVVVRRHPAERFKHLASKDDYAGALTRRFGANERVRYIPAEAEVNTYDLIEQAKVVVPYVSTVGIEAAALGKPVITEGASCYSGLGFVWSAQTAEEYFALLRQALAGELMVSTEKQEAAWRCYYLTQCCNWLHTIFTPQASDFEKWVLSAPDELMASPEVTNTLTAIDCNIPLSIINHNALKLERNKSLLN